MDNPDEVLYEVKDRVATITINRPQARNSLNAGVIAGLSSMLDRAMAESEVGSIVITGAGGKAFCAGADLAGSFSRDKSFLGQHEERGHFARLLFKMNRCKKPILAAVEGYCLAGGLGLCLSADLVVASDDSQFGLPEIQRGLWPYIVTAVLIRNVGRKKALELCMIGERISAAEAERIGMINSCVPKAAFKERVEGMARKLASFSPAVMGLGKESFYAIADIEFAAAIEYLKSQLTLNTQCEDLKEGIKAFLEKREPKWQGR
ncbi:MAG: crotonase [Deltaproteobacteria bacterium]|nr:crotonase [Deltaproteobacteria bacterium]